MYYFQTYNMKTSQEYEKKIPQVFSFWADPNVMVYKLLQCLMWIKIIGVI